MTQVIVFLMFIIELVYCGHIHDVHLVDMGLEIRVTRLEFSAFYRCTDDADEKVRVRVRVRFGIRVTRVRTRVRVTRVTVGVRA